MDVLAFVTGAFLVAVILFLIYKEMDDDHKLFRYFILGLIFLTMLFIPKVLLDDSDFCQTKPVNATVTGSLTEYQYDYVCTTNENNTATTFFRFALIIVTISIFYWMVYIIQYLFEKTRRWFKK